MHVLRTIADRVMLMSQSVPLAMPCLRHVNICAMKGNNARLKIKRSRKNAEFIKRDIIAEKLRHLALITRKY